MRSRLAGSLLFLLLVASVAAKERLSFDEKDLVRRTRELMERIDAPTRSELEKAGKLMAKGIAHHDAGRFEKAIALYEEALDHAPLDFQLHYEIALSLSTMGRHEDALRSVIVSEVLAGGDHSNPSMFKASLLDDLGYTESAIAVYTALLEEDPSRAGVRIDLAVTLMRLGRLEQAEFQLRRALEIDPEWAPTHYQLSTLASVRKDPVAEAAALREFLRLAPKERRAITAKRRLKELESPRPPAPAASKEVEQGDEEAIPVGVFVFSLVEESERAYLLGGPPSDPAAWLAGEASRMRAGLKLRGPSRLKRARVLKDLELSLLRDDARVLPAALRLLRPGDPEWRLVEGVVAAHGLRLDFVGPPAAGSVEETGSNETSVRWVEGTEAWFPYWMAKATWKHEALLRSAVNGPEDSRPSVLEEQVAVATALDAHEAREAPREGEEGRLDRLAAVADAGLLKGYVLVELIHHRYGLPLEALSEEDAAVVESYLRSVVLRRRR